jgi:hypothetical protein
MKVSDIGEDTTINKIVNLVEEAANSKARLAQLADTVSAYFVPVVISIALIVFLSLGIHLSELGPRHQYGRLGPGRFLPLCFRLGHARRRHGRNRQGRRTWHPHQIRVRFRRPRSSQSLGLR